MRKKPGCIFVLLWALYNAESGPNVNRKTQANVNLPCTVQTEAALKCKKKVCANPGA